MSGEYFDRDGSPLADVDAWVRLFQNKDYQRLRYDEAGGYRVSTVWLGMNHNFSDEGEPLIFETMLFGDGPRDEECHRYSTEAEAVAGHERLLAELEPIPNTETESREG